MANGAAFGHAVSLISGNKEIGIGVHLCLVDERPLLPAARIPGLVDENGFFPRNYRHLLFRLCKGKIKLAHVKEELEAQIKKVMDSGIMPTHLDSHQYTHLIPGVFNLTVQLAKKYRINWIRYPRENINIHTLSFRKIYPMLFSGMQLKTMRQNRIRYPDFSFGLTFAGRLNDSTLKSFLERIDFGLTDINCHPGHIPKEKRYTSWGYHWEEEAAAFNSQDFKNLAARLNIVFTNYAYQ